MTEVSEQLALALNPLPTVTEPEFIYPERNKDNEQDNVYDSRLFYDAREDKDSSGKNKYCS